MALKMTGEVCDLQTLASISTGNENLILSHGDINPFKPTTRTADLERKFDTGSPDSPGSRHIDLL